MHTPTFLAAVAALAVAPAVRGDETPAKGTIAGVDLFKNGLAVVRCEVTLGKPGTYALADVPQPVHGTYWVESPVPVETAVRVRDVEVPAADTPPGDLQTDLAGKGVTITFKGTNRPPVVGKVLKMKPNKDEPANPRFLVLQTGAGRTYVDVTDIAAVESGDAGATVTRRRPQLLLTLGATDKPQTKVTLRYLTHGLSWAPSYRIDISDPKALTLEQRAEVRNELADLADADVRLISGFPSVQYMNVRGLLAPRTGLAGFFNELAGGGAGRFADALSNTVALQQVMSNPRSGATAPAMGAIPTGEGVDLHYQPVGKRTLADGDTLSLTVASGKAEYRRIVEWQVPDARDDWGRYNGRGRGESDDESPWDALQFKNPLPFPMTTAPATVTANGSFAGQRTSYWVNPGEETVLRVEKALSVRTRAGESETQRPDGGDTRERVWVGGRSYRRSTVAGELAVGNNRKEAVSLVIRRRFSGELVTADAGPKVNLLPEGVYSVNKRNELTWAIDLKGGDERTLKYTYTVLVAD